MQFYELNAVRMIHKFFKNVYCCRFQVGEIQLLEHKEHALRMFILQLRTSVDFVQRSWNIWENGIGLNHMQRVCIAGNGFIFFRTWASGVHYVNVLMNS